MTDYKPIRKAVLPVAGLGTRFLPATKAMPKEMLTVVDKPVVQYAVEEAAKAGITEIIFVTGRGKSTIENHFDHPYELSATLSKRGKTAELEAVENVLPKGCRAFYTRQGQPLGLGHAVLCAKPFVGDEPFAVLLPDDIIWNEGSTPLAEMAKVYEQTGQSVVLTSQVPLERTANYGVLDTHGEQPAGGVVSAYGFVEKPGAEKAPSTFAVSGRYILTPRIFDLIEQGTAGHGGEIQLTDAMHKLALEEGFKGYIMPETARRFDCGDKVEYQMANLFFALQDAYIAPRLSAFIHQLDGQNKIQK